MIFRLFIFISFALFIASCKKDTSVMESSISENEGTAFLSLHHKFGDQDFYLDSIYVLDDGKRVRFNNIGFYLSGIQLKNEKDSHNFEDKYLLCRVYQTEYELGKLKPGNFNKISFDVGIDSLTNHGDPSVYPSDHPLALQLQSMHWGWNSGYVFIMLEGEADTTSSGSGDFDRSFFYHIGSHLLFTESLSFNKNIQIIKSEKTFIELDIDYKKVFLNLNVKTHFVTMTFDNYILARNLKENFINAIELLR